MASEYAFGEPRLCAMDAVAGDRLTPALEERVAAIARGRLDAVDTLTERLVRGELDVY